MLPDLIKATPELTQQQRQMFFGARSAREQSDLASLFKRADKQQRQTLYAQLKQWSLESSRGSN